MKIEQRHWRAGQGWTPVAAARPAQLVLVFGSEDALDAARIEEIRGFWPGAALAGCTTAGEILDTRVYDRSVTATALTFSAVQVRVAVEPADGPGQSRAAGAALGRTLAAEPELAHLLVFSDGLSVNGSELVAGLRDAVPAGVAITGGLAADGARFAETAVIADGAPRGRCVVAVGFYGRGLRVGYGSLGGWDAFGADRVITRSRANVLYELDGEPALALYQRYLGEQAAGLPATGLLFPLALHAADGRGPGLVRTILAVDEQEQSMTFAGDMPEGRVARLMKANFDRLVEGAAGAAQAAGTTLGRGAELALLISCVGRRLVLKQRVEEELESVRRVLGPGAALTGFYSYGEISPFAAAARCELHNQTMTITSFSEA